MRSTRWLLALAALLVASALPRAARAEDVEKQVARMNKMAMEDYDSLEFESARKTLIDAVAMLRENGYDSSPIAARTYTNLGILYIAGFKDRNRGIQQFVNALKIKPDLKLDPAIATPELEDAFQTARKQVGVKAPSHPETPVTPPPELPPTTPPTLPNETPPTPPASAVKGLQHNPVDESRPDTPIPIRAQLGDDVGATRLFLFFRSDGQADFVSVPMKHTSGAEWVGVIPAEAVTGRALQYYLEARDARGRVVTDSGSAPSPYIVAISENAAPPTGIPEVDVEDPLAQLRARQQREKEEKRHHKRQYVFGFVMLGTGFGYQPSGNKTEVAWQYQPVGSAACPPMQDCYARQTVGSGGVALAPLHVAVELGAFINQAFSLSVLGRFEVYTGSNAETIMTGTQQSPTTKASGSVAALLRARYRFLSGRFHPYIHVDFGGGLIRQVLDVSQANPDHPLVDSFTGQSYNMGDRAGAGQITEGNQNVCANPASCSDTIALGYLLLGGGAGLWYDVHPNVGLILDINLLGAINPTDNNSSNVWNGMNLDIQLGVGAHF